MPYLYESSVQPACPKCGHNEFEINIIKLVSKNYSDQKHYGTQQRHVIQCADCGTVIGLDSLKPKSA